MVLTCYNFGMEGLARYSLSEAHEEAKKLVEIIETGEAQDYQGAEDFLNQKFMEEKSRIEALLKDHDIDTQSWGKGGAKSIDHLVREVLSGEARLEDREGELLRIIKVVSVIIEYCLDDMSKCFQLKESKQQFRDGRTKTRNLPGSLGEKLKSDEVPEEAAVRAVQEELDIRDGVKVEKIGGETVRKYGNAYPGLCTDYSVDQFKVMLDANQFREEGYKEEQSDKTVFFEWQAVQTRAA